MHLQNCQPLSMKNQIDFRAPLPRTSPLTSGQEKTRHEGGFPGDWTVSSQAATEPSKTSENGVMGIARISTATTEAMLARVT